MTLVTPEKRAHLQSIGRLGGLTTAATIDVTARAKAGQSKFREGFTDGHGCKLCRFIEIPTDLDATERKRRADLLFTIHFGRLARARR
jgi:hypothetical protein